MAEPLVPRLPDTLTAYKNKYNRIGGDLAALPLPITNSLQQFDLRRVLQGRNPTSTEETARMLATAISGQAATPEKARSTNPLKIFGNAVQDASQILHSIPKLPGALIEEARSLPDLPENLAEADNISEMLQVPGIRMIPGTYTLSNILGGKPGEAIRHPLFTGLDVLPFAGKAVGGAVKAGAAEAEVLGKELTQTQRVLNAYEAQKGVVSDAFKRTAPGQLLQQLGGREARTQARIKSAHDLWLQEVFHNVDNPSDLVNISPKMRETVQKAQEFQTKWTSIPEARQVELTKAMQEAPDTLATQTLNPVEQAFVDESRQVADDLARVAADEGWIEQVNGEWYDQTTARRIQGVRRRHASAMGRVDGKVLDRLARSRDPRAIPIADAIRNGDLGTARRLTSNAIRSRSINPELNYTHKALGTATHFQKRLDELVTNTPPARFLPHIQEQVRQGLLAKYSHDPDFANISQHIVNNTYGLVKGLKEDAANLADEIAGTWQDLKAAGIDPVFIHRVSPSQAAHLKFPRTVEALRTPHSAKARNLYDITPSVQNATVAIPAHGLELLARKANESMVDAIRTIWGRSQNDVLLDYLPAAQRRAELVPSLDVPAHAQSMMRKEWSEFHPEEFVTWASPRLKTWGTEPVMIPKALAKNFERMHKPPEGGFYAAMDPVMKVFRTSLLPLSPRWHVYNIFGGAMMAALEDPRILTYLPQAAKMAAQAAPDLFPNLLAPLRKGPAVARMSKEVVTATPKEIPRGIGTLPRESLEWDAMTSKEFAQKAFALKGGATMRRIWDSIAPAREAGGKLVAKSYEFNAFFDDMYRAAAYLSDFDKSLTKGLSRAEANTAGISLARKVYQRWDEMTPLERTVLRYVMPFYGFTSHVARYLSRYPFDHPVRASILGTVARKEMEDMGTGLPQKFLSMFFLGDTDEDGNVKVINTAGMNPFGDVANLFTWSGFLGGTNPIFTSFLESIGVDIQQGGAELYPNLEYDPESGRLRSKSTNFLSNLFQNTVPQAQVLQSYLGQSSEFKELLRSNPEAAARLVRSQAGFPVLFRKVNVPEEQFRGELARGQAQKDTLSKAFKSGDFGEASRYPGLGPLIQQVEQLQGTPALDAYRSPNEGITPLEAINQALVKSNVP